MRILVLGGDGYLGWPTALHLSQAGHDVAVADNFGRRQYDFEGYNQMTEAMSVKQIAETVNPEALRPEVNWRDHISPVQENLTTRASRA